MRHQVDQGISSFTPDRDPLMPKQLDEQRNGRRTDPPDKFKGRLLHVFIATVEESPQQRQRTA
jgi:hypothetical protein